MKTITTLALLSLAPVWCATAYSQSATVPEALLVAHIDSCLERLLQIQHEVKDIHPYLADFHPVALVEGEELYVFDVDSLSGRYKLQKKGPGPFAMSKGIRASFPLSSYGGKPSCVVSPEVFDELKGYAIILHEFIHCAQYQSIEPELRENLEIARQAARTNDYSWEITHSFPYQDSVFTKEYGSFLEALEKGDGKKVEGARHALKRHLRETDYEYMVWEEWKEGFARFIENKIRARLGVPANQGGSDRPYNRVTFYYGGEMFVRFLVWHNEELLTDMKKLFGEMMAGEF
ncbi:hypothetical protein EHM92_03290 [bacterium]|nr:MAG: hypothetical protein EHM92_03290 [bacterium]